MNGAIAMLVLGAAFGGLFLLAECAHRYAHLPAEATRKGVHIGTGLLTMLFPFWLRNAVEVGILCGIFLVILIWSLNRRSLPSINAIKRKSWGSVLYPVVVFGVYIYYIRYGKAPLRLFHPIWFFATPILVMAFCDPLAAWAGSLYRNRCPAAPPGKTMVGSFAFFIASILLIGCLGAFLKMPSLPLRVPLVCGIVLAFIATLAERFSGGGWDNLTIPLAIMAGQVIFETGLRSVVH